MLKEFRNIVRRRRDCETVTHGSSLKEVWLLVCILGDGFQNSDSGFCHHVQSVRRHILDLVVNYASQSVFAIGFKLGDFMRFHCGFSKKGAIPKLCDTAAIDCFCFKSLVAVGSAQSSFSKESQPGFTCASIPKSTSCSTGTTADSAFPDIVAVCGTCFR